MTSLPPRPFNNLHVLFLLTHREMPRSFLLQVQLEVLNLLVPSKYSILQVLHLDSRSRAPVIVRKSQWLSPGQTFGVIVVTNALNVVAAGKALGRSHCMVPSLFSFDL